MDWEQIRGRLARSERAGESLLQPTGERLEAIWRERAARLAKHTISDAASRDEIPVITFRIGAETYSVKLTDAGEVLPLTGLAPVPGAPAYVAGVIEVRGRIRPVLSVAKLPGIETADDEGPHYALMLRRGRLAIGLKVGLVTGFQQLAADELEQANTHVRWIQARTAGGLTLLAAGALFEEIRETDATDDR